MDIKYLKQLSDDMHRQHAHVLPLWQEMAMEFWPEMADFTQTKNDATQLAAHLMSGTPALCRRELGDAFEAMLRQGDWFSIKTGDPERDKDTAARAWLEAAGSMQMRVMYNRKAGFQRACKMVDHGYATTGQWPMSIEMNENRNGVLYRAWHLRDVAFQESLDGQINIISHKMKLRASDVLKMFGDACSDNIKKTAKDKPFDKVDIVRMVLPTEMYDTKKMQPFVSIYFDPQSGKELECAGVWNLCYVIPRWQLSGSISQYALSPASMIAYPDARMFQQMSLSMLDAAEKGANPPMIARENLFREDWQGAANSIGWADMEADEDIRKAFQVLTNDKSGSQFAEAMLQRTKQDLQRAWYNDLLQPPDTTRAKTAYEASIIMQNHIRGLIPVFQPVSAEYQAPVCEMTFDILMRMGAFGPPGAIPETLQGTDIEFEFVSPLSQAEDQKKVAQFSQMVQLLSEASGIDQSARFVFKIDTALRDAAEGGDILASWMNTEQEAKDLADQAAKEQQQQAMLDQIQQGSEIAKNLGGAGAGSGAGVQGAIGQGIGVGSPNNAETGVPA